MAITSMPNGSNNLMQNNNQILLLVYKANIVQVAMSIELIVNL